MTDNEIIKALECCVQYTTTDVRTYKGMPLEVFSQAVLDLINRQRAEIKRLKSKVNRLEKYDEERDIRLHARLTETARTEAIKEFADKLQEYLADHNAVSASYLSKFVKKLAKELTEGDSNAEITE